MSDEPTKNIEEKYDTRPTIETVLERLDVVAHGLIPLRDEMRDGFVQIDTRLKKVENKISVLNEDVLELRSDVRELKNSLKVHEPR
ncbi:MAG TPA: hypothetical protein VGB76_12590 [Pyrinomonadaceae bacterium]|jgi:predicted  nucleic acid-binding Zn-ribbon protein